jgi:hypothetical protein
MKGILNIFHKFSFTYLLAGVLASLLALFLSNFDETYAYTLYKEIMINIFEKEIWVYILYKFLNGVTRIE